MVHKYRKMPIVEAIQYLREENISEIQSFIKDGSLQFSPKDNEYILRTVDGDYVLKYGYYIVKDVDGQYYLHSPDVFSRMYTIYSD